MTDLEPELVLQPQFLTSYEADDLFLLLRATTQWNQQMASRFTASFGVPYEYSGISYETLAMPDRVNDVAKKLAHKLGFLPNNCLLNYYLTSNSKMGYHSDDTQQLAKGTGVAIVSLGQSREMTFKHKTQPDITHRYMLTHGSLLYMDDKVQQDWLHAIPKLANSGAQEVSGQENDNQEGTLQRGGLQEDSMQKENSRISLTFRQLKG